MKCTLLCFKTVVLLALATASAVPAWAKSASTVFTAQRQANAQRNASFSWTERDSHAGYTQFWLNHSLAAVHAFVHDPSLPRANNPVMSTLCPNGKPVRKWFVDPDVPFKVKCIDTDDTTPDITYPENDFASHYARNRSASGEYLYPPTDTTFCNPANAHHDCGYGAVYSGRRYFFVAYYVHDVANSISRLDLGDPLNGRSLLWSGALTWAFNGPINGAPAARRVAMALDALADRFAGYLHWYPIHIQRQPAIANVLSGSTGVIFGNVVDGIAFTNMVRAYDIVYPIFDDPQLLSALAALHPGATAASVRQHIEEDLLWAAVPKVMDRTISGNSSLPQNLMLHLAFVLDGGSRSQPLIDWVFAPGKGRLPELFLDNIDRDGGCDEVAATYCSLGYTHYLATGEVLELFARGDFALTQPLTVPSEGLQRHQFRLSRFFRFARQLTTIPNFYVHLGDEGFTGRAAKPPIASTDQLVLAFDRFGPDHELAAQAREQNGGTLTGLHTTFWDTDPESVQTRLAASLATEGVAPIDETNLAGYGFAQLAGGAPGQEHSVWGYFGRSNNAMGSFGHHGHHDALDFGIQYRGLDFMPPPGYPSGFGWRYFGWEANTAVHNSIVVDRTTQSRNMWASDIRTYLDTPGSPVSVMELESTTAYPGVYEYPTQLANAKLARFLVKVPLGGGPFFVLELSTARGGTVHHYSYHGGGTSIKMGSIRLQNTSNTYAGVDAGTSVAYESPYDFDEVDATCRASMTCVEQNAYLYRGSGFQFLRNASVRDSTSLSPFTADWSQIDWNTFANTSQRLKGWFLPLAGIDQIATATGRMPHGENVPYLMVRAENGSTGSGMLNVWQPYSGSPLISQVNLVSNTFTATGEVVAVDVKLGDGRFYHIGIDLTPGAPQAHTAGRLAWTGKVAVYAEKRGSRIFAYLAEGSRLEYNGVPQLSNVRPSYTGSINAFQESDGANSVQTSSAVDAAGAVDRWVDFQPSTTLPYYLRRDATYRVRGVSQSSGVFSLDLGDEPLLLGHLDRNNYSAGFRYHVAPGDSFRIPLDTWR